MKQMILVAGILIIFLIVAVIIVGIRGSKSELPKGVLKIGNHEFEVDIAENIFTREKGLSGRKELKENEGMFFIFNFSAKQGFWMKDMNFPLDMIWIMDNKVIGATENVPPPPKENPNDLPVYYSPQSVNMVLEVSAGTVSKLGIKEGDSVELIRK